MYPRRSHTLAPLTRVRSSNWRFKLMQVEQDNFDKIKRIVACDNLLTDLNFNKAFKIHTSASTFQLEVVISQKGKHITFYTRNLTDDQQWYTVPYRELLKILETMK